MGIIKRYKNYFKDLMNQNYELLWAKTWDDTRNGIKWMEDLPSISPGRWAVGYNYLYVMTRVLNETEPKNVIDFGPGISSTLISLYYSHNEIEGVHDIVEQDENWASFYTTKHTLSKNSTIHTIECTPKMHNGIEYLAYKDISQVVSGKKYDVVSIDGPMGSERHARRDIVDYIPEVLNDSFVILIDDAERVGERDTINEIKEVLKKNGIGFCEGSYPGLSNLTVITSEDKRFICSM